MRKGRGTVPSFAGTTIRAAVRSLLSHVAGVCLVAAVLAAPAAAATITINFDSIPTGTNIDGVDLGGVTLTTADGSTWTLNEGGVGYISGPNAVTTFGFMQTNFLVMTFSSIVSSVTLTGGDRGGDTDQFIIRAYDSSDVFLGSATTPIFGGNPVGGPAMQDFFTQSIAFQNIKRVEVQSLINAGIGIDNLSFSIDTTVPEPGTGLLVLAALAAGCVVRRRLA